MAWLGEFIFLYVKLPVLHMSINGRPTLLHRLRMNRNRHLTAYLDDVSSPITEDAIWCGYLFLANMYIFGWKERQSQRNNEIFKGG